MLFSYAFLSAHHREFQGYNQKMTSKLLEDVVSYSGAWLLTPYPFYVVQAQDVQKLFLQQRPKYYNFP